MKNIFISANVIIASVFAVCYAYQAIYLLISLVRKSVTFDCKSKSKYAVIIAARNEENVISHLIGSIHAQDYPRELVDIYVVADNCTDSTADVARESGATVFERFNKLQIGKGYALEFLFDKLKEKKGVYNGYFFFDADNLLESNYISEMNKAFSEGNKLITSYRNSKNFGDNWVSAGYSISFLRDSAQINNARMIIGTSCKISGTGFLVHRDIIEKNGGWKHFLLTEDAEFTIDNVLCGEKIAYCKSAVFYDEQPTSFRQSCSQRMRWAKGYYQVFSKYGSSLIKRIFSKNGLACFDMTMSIMPAMIITILCGVLNICGVLAGLINGENVSELLMSMLMTMLKGYFTLFITGAVAVFTERKLIRCSKSKKILHCFTFPIFMFTYIPIAAVALIKKVEWTPVRHHKTTTISDIAASLNK